jgi:SPP1 family predicted phage head-tail adaptor
VKGLIIGTLRDRVRLETPERTDAGGGGATVTWSSLGQIYARIEPASGREIVEADGVTARVTHSILIRHRTDIGSHMRFAAGPRIFDIKSVRETGGHRRWLECHCEEHLP